VLPEPSAPRCTSERLAAKRSNQSSCCAAAVSSQAPSWAARSAALGSSVLVSSHIFTSLLSQQFKIDVHDLFPSFRMFLASTAAQIKTNHWTANFRFFSFSLAYLCLIATITVLTNPWRPYPPKPPCTAHSQPCPPCFHTWPGKHLQHWDWDALSSICCTGRVKKIPGCTTCPTTQPPQHRFNRRPRLMAFTGFQLFRAYFVGRY
jgi:hypothetical protein